MNELLPLLARARALVDAGRTAVLGTVVAVDGSAYRREGARILVEPDGRLTGVVSGGCLERDIAAHAAQVVAARAARLVTYDLRSPEEALWGLGLGCGGTVTLLLEPLAGDSPACLFLETLERVVAERRVVDLVTMYRTNDAAGEHARSDGTPVFETAAAVFETPVAPLRVEVREALGSTSYLAERLLPPVRLLICGAERDSPPLARLARELSWEVVVADPRASAERAARFDDEVRIIPGRPDGIARSLALDGRTVAVVMTHSYLDDVEFVAALWPSPIPYLGLLGPAARRDRLIADLAMRGLPPESMTMARLKAPAGIELGGRSPEVVALSILAEAQAVLAGAGARPLSSREATPALPLPVSAGVGSP